MDFQSFASVNVSFPQLFIEWDDNEQSSNETKVVLYPCKDLQTRMCKYVESEFDVGSTIVFIIFHYKNNLHLYTFLQIF